MSAVWTQTRGDGGPTFVFLHGLNANAGVWAGVDAALAATRMPTRRVHLDLPGHGRSAPLTGGYSLGAVASAVAHALNGLDEPAVLVGHSMGGAVALALASGWFGVPVRGVFGIGVKTEWSDAERAGAARFATVAPRPFETHEAAEAFLLKAAGITGGSELAEFRRVGVVEHDGAFFIAAQPAAAALATTWRNTVFDAIGTPFRLARGSEDVMVPAAPVRELDPSAVEFAGAGHNAHVEASEPVAAAIRIFADSLDRTDGSTS